MEVSVIIPSLNEGKYIRRTLECLRKQTVQDFETIIIDGNSTDETRDVAKEYTDKFFILKKRGVSLARNYGANKSRGSLLAMTDADTLLPPTWLERIQQVMREKDLEMVYGPVYYTPDVTLPMRLQVGAFWNVHRFVWKNAPFTMNPNLAFTKDGFKKIDGYRTDMHFMDDYDIGCRSIKRLRSYFDFNNPVIFSARRYRTLRSYVADIPKSIRGFAQYHLTNRTTDTHIPMVR